MYRILPLVLAACCAVSAQIPDVADTNSASSDSLAGLHPVDGSVHDRQVLLWPDGVPGALDTAASDQPALTIHLPDADKANGAAVVVNPGGGYRILAADHEGLQVARELNRQGIAAFVLRYRLGPKYEVADSLLDAQRAMRHVRHHADKYHVDAERIGMLGFSAGGHLTSNVGTHFDAGNPAASDPVDHASSRPDFMVLVYPAIAGELFNKESSYPSTHKHVTAETPPAFLVHTHEDFLSPNHSVYFYQALLKEKIPAELHVFGFGPHGTGLAPGDPDLGQWPKLLGNWLRRSGFLSSEKRIAIKGSVTVNGEPLYWGWLTLIPEDANRPTVTSYMGWNNEGKFTLDAKHGPVPGKYRGEVRRVATEFSDKTSGAYSMADAELVGSVAIEVLDAGSELQVNVQR